MSVFDHDNVFKMSSILTQIFYIVNYDVTKIKNELNQICVTIK